VIFSHQFMLFMPLLCCCEQMGHALSVLMI
jgi:hypothetical protein